MAAATGFKAVYKHSTVAEFKTSQRISYQKPAFILQNAFKNILTFLLLLICSVRKKSHLIYYYWYRPDYFIKLNRNRKKQMLLKLYKTWKPLFTQRKNIVQNHNTSYTVRYWAHYKWLIIKYDTLNTGLCWELTRNGDALWSTGVCLQYSVNPLLNNNLHFNVNGFTRDPFVHKAARFSQLFNYILSPTTSTYGGVSACAGSCIISKYKKTSEC